MYIYTEVKNCTAGQVTFTPTNAKGAPLFSSIAFASASGVSGVNSPLNAILCGIGIIATDATSLTFNCVGNTGILLGGNSFASVDGKPIRCFILGKENLNAVATMNPGEFDGVFYKV